MDALTIAGLFFLVCLWGSIAGHIWLARQKYLRRRKRILHAT